MTNGPVQVITSVERRRRQSCAEKQQLVAAWLEPGAPVWSAGSWDTPGHRTTKEGVV